MNRKILKNRLEERYFRWLCELVDCKLNLECEDLLLFLYSREFYSLVPNDDNRVGDGLQLREFFREEKEIPTAEVEALLNRPCTVLEMMIGVAARMGYILFDFKSGDQSPKWFWLLVNNLRLKPRGRDNDVIVENLLERNYASTGDGGLFPLKNPDEDQRKVEIWYQMMAYIRSVLQ